MEKRTQAKAKGKRNRRGKASGQSAKVIITPGKVTKAKQEAERKRIQAALAKGTLQPNVKVKIKAAPELAAEWTRLVTAFAEGLAQDLSGPKTRGHPRKKSP